MVQNPQNDRSDIHLDVDPCQEWHRSWFRSPSYFIAGNQCTFDAKFPVPGMKVIVRVETASQYFKTSYYHVASYSVVTCMCAISIRLRSPTSALKTMEWLIPVARLTPSAQDHHLVVVIRRATSTPTPQTTMATVVLKQVIKHHRIEMSCWYRTSRGANDFSARPEQRQQNRFAFFAQLADGQRPPLRRLLKPKLQRLQRCPAYPVLMAWLPTLQLWGRRLEKQNVSSLTSTARWVMWRAVELTSVQCLWYRTKGETSPWHRDERMRRVAVSSRRLGGKRRSQLQRKGGVRSLGQGWTHALVSRETYSLSTSCSSNNTMLNRDRLQHRSNHNRPRSLRVSFPGLLPWTSTPNSPNIQQVYRPPCLQRKTSAVVWRRQQAQMTYGPRLDRDSTRTRAVPWALLYLASWNPMRALRPAGKCSYSYIRWHPTIAAFGIMSNVFLLMFIF